MTQYHKIHDNSDIKQWIEDIVLIIVNFFGHNNRIVKIWSSQPDPDYCSHAVGAESQSLILKDN